MPPRSPAASGDDDEVAALFALPPREFTAARNALAARVVRSGNRVGAARIKALAKPTLSAWAVNALARTEREALDALVAAGDHARAAQARALAGGSADALRARVGEVRDALLDLRQRAARLLREAGSAAGEDTLERVTTTLRTASQSPEAAELVRAGRLVEDLDPLGIAVLSAGPRSLRTRDDEPQERRPSGSSVPERGLRGARAAIAAAARGARAEPKVDARGDAARARRRREADAELTRERAARRRGAVQDLRHSEAVADRARRAVDDAAAALRDAEGQLAKSQARADVARSRHAKARKAAAEASEAAAAARRRVEELGGDEAAD